MGIIRAVKDAIGGTLADQWLEVVEPEEMGAQTVFTEGVSVGKNDRRNNNRRGTDNYVSNGSVIHVYPNQFMILVSGGKIIDYTAEEGYYKVDQGAAPSLFNGEFGEVLQDAFERVKFGGSVSSQMKVYYINLQEIKGIKFGTKTPINYFDTFYNAELFLRTHGTYSIKITNPLLFYAEAIPRDKDHVEISDINEQYLSEFLEALQAAINQLSADGIRISFVPSKGRELSKYMSTILDEDWRVMRGMEVQSVGIASISYDSESTKLINMRNQGAMLGDPTVREGYVQGAIARGLEAAGSNKNGSMAGFMGMGVGMQATGGFMGTASQTNMQQMQMNQQMQQQQMQQQQMQMQQQQQIQAAPAAGAWDCACGQTGNTGNFCSACGQKRPEKTTWTCSCGHENTGNFCSECGKKKVTKIRCDKCGYEPDMSQAIPKFCPNCGDPINEADM